jgi:hypothetical protein
VQVTQIDFLTGPAVGFEPVGVRAFAAFVGESAATGLAVETLQQSLVSGFRFCAARVE